jgi:hypothetical protein
MKEQVRVLWGSLEHSLFRTACSPFSMPCFSCRASLWRVFLQLCLLNFFLTMPKCFWSRLRQCTRAGKRWDLFLSPLFLIPLSSIFFFYFYSSIHFKMFIIVLGHEHYWRSLQGRRTARILDHQQCPGQTQWSDPVQWEEHITPPPPKNYCTVPLRSHQALKFFAIDQCNKSCYTVIVLASVGEMTIFYLVKAKKKETNYATLHLLKCVNKPLVELKISLNLSPPSHTHRHTHTHTQTHEELY